jgi:hypothetical protein
MLFVRLNYTTRQLHLGLVIQVLQQHSPVYYDHPTTAVHVHRSTHSPMQLLGANTRLAPATPLTRMTPCCC